MSTDRSSAFKPDLSRDDYAALEQVSRGLKVPPHVSQRLIDLGLVTRALGVFALTPCGSFKLASGPASGL